MIITRNKDKWQGVNEFRSGDISCERETFKYLGTVLNEGNDIDRSGNKIKSKYWK
jgi:hypothetical protein